MDMDCGGPSVWSRFTGEQQASIWCYRELLKFFSANMPEHLSRMDRAIMEMQSFPAASSIFR